MPAFNEWKTGRRERFWTASRDVQLLEWVEKHPFESRIIFSKVSNWHDAPRDQNDELMTKKSCYKRAAQSIFSNEKDPAVLRQLGGKQGGRMIEGQLLKWIKKYRDIKSMIEDARPNEKLEEIEPGTEIFHNLQPYWHSHFPLWGRLHAQWRTYPEDDLEIRLKKCRPYVPKKSSRNVIVVTDSDSDFEDVKPTIGIEDPRQTARVANRNSRRHTPTAARGDVERSNTSQPQEVNLGDRIRIQTLENEHLRMRMMMEKQQSIQEERKRLQEALINGLIATNTPSQSTGDEATH